MDNGIIKIPLSRGFFTYVDQEHFETPKRLSLKCGIAIEVIPSSIKWQAEKSSSEYYAKTTRRVFGDGSRRKASILLHRLIMQVSPWLVVDHRNGDTLLNIMSNLRICTISQNNSNRISKLGSTSRYLGVSLESGNRGKKWAVSISSCTEHPSERKTVHGGRFATEEEAALAYNELAIKYHGEFARLNVIPATVNS